MHWERLTTAAVDGDEALLYKYLEYFNACHDLWMSSRRKSVEDHNRRSTRIRRESGGAVASAGSAGTAAGCAAARCRETAPRGAGLAPLSRRKHGSHLGSCGQWWPAAQEGSRLGMSAPPYLDSRLPAHSWTVIRPYDPKADTALHKQRGISFKTGDQKDWRSVSPNLVRQSEHMTPLAAPGAGHQVMHGVDISVAQLCPFCRAHT